MWTCIFSAIKKHSGFLWRAALAAAVLAGPATAGEDGIQRLIQAYPQHLCGAEGNFLVWCDGERMPYDDGNSQKTHSQKLENADLQDQMEQPYPRGADYPVPPPTDFEPGRIRNEAFFRKMYGNNAEEVRRRLAPVEWLPRSGGQQLWVTTVNRVHERLKAVSDELDTLPASLRRFVDRPAGGFNWRVIAREKRLSPHSFGIAVDMNTSTADYWQWQRGGDRGPIAYRNRIPLEIVLIFEKHGFIWGGKWHHFDTPHFEYRPELLVKSPDPAPDGKPASPGTTGD